MQLSQVWFSFQEQFYNPVILRPQTKTKIHLDPHHNPKDDLESVVTKRRKK